MPENKDSNWWSRLEKIEDLRQRTELALLIPDLTDKNRARLENCLKALDELEATARFQLGLPYKPLQ